MTPSPPALSNLSVIITGGTGSSRASPSRLCRAFWEDTGRHLRHLDRHETFCRRRGGFAAPRWRGASVSTVGPQPSPCGSNHHASSNIDNRGIDLTPWTGHPTVALAGFITLRPHRCDCTCLTCFRCFARPRMFQISVSRLTPHGIGSRANRASCAGPMACGSGSTSSICFPDARSVILSVLIPTCLCSRTHRDGCSTTSKTSGTAEHKGKTSQLQAPFG